MYCPAQDKCLVRCNNSILFNSFVANLFVLAPALPSFLNENSCRLILRHITNSLFFKSDAITIYFHLTYLFEFSKLHDCDLNNTDLNNTVI